MGSRPRNCLYMLLNQRGVEGDDWVGGELTTLVELTEGHARKVCPAQDLNPIDAATGQGKRRGTRHPLQNVRNPPTQLRPPHPALVCLLASTLHPHLLLLHPSSPSPDFSCDLLSAPQFLSVGTVRRVPSFRPDCGEGLQRGCAWRLRRVRALELPTRAPASSAKEATPDLTLQ